MGEWEDPVNSVPVLFVSGTHYEASRLTGRTFAAQIKTYCKNVAGFLERAEAYCATEIGKEYYDGFYEVGQRRCPQYMDEIRGLADGSGVPFQKIFFLNHMREFVELLPLIAEKSKAEGEGHKGCTDILVSNEDEVLLCHTEDGISQAKDTDYVVVANIVESTNEDGRVYEAEKFVSHCIAGNIPGWCVAFNQHGMAYIENSLFPTACPTKKLGEVLHQRHLLAAKNVDDVLRIVEDKDHGSNSAFCLKFGFQGSSTLYSVEILPRPIDIPGNTIHVREIGGKGDGDKAGHYIHTNHYIELDVSSQLCSNSSRYRLKTLQHMNAPRTMIDVCERLGLNKVHRQNEQVLPTLTIFTLCTDIIDLVAGEFLMYRKRTGPSESPLLRLPFSILK